METETWIAVCIGLLGLAVHWAAMAMLFGRYCSRVEAIEARCVSRATDCKQHFVTAEKQGVAIAEHAVKIGALQVDVRGLSKRMDGAT